MTRATGVGSMPQGTLPDAEAFAEAVRVVLGELPELPHLPELPGRGPAAAITGRGAAVLSGLAVDLQPAGWRLTDAPGVDQRRARSLLAQDLDTFEELTEGWTGPVKVQVAGPWTLAATIERPRGDKVLSDHGARRDLAQALAEGVTAHVADVRRRVPDASGLVVQVDEPALAGVLAGAVPTASGWGRHRVVHPPEASQALEWVLGAITDAGAEPWVHACASGTPLGLVRGAGARGLSVDVARLSPADHDVLAEALEAGDSVVLGIVATDALAGVDEGGVVAAVERWLDMLGLDPATGGDRLLLSPACGLAGATPQAARHALRTLRAAAAHLTG